MTLWQSEEMSDDEFEAFMDRVFDIETAPQTTHLRQLAELGVDLPAPETMDDAALTKKLWEVIHALSGLQVFLDSTDHLSDRELYAWLLRDVLPDEIPDGPDVPGSFWTLDPLVTGSESAMHTRLKYYADENERRQWKEEFPDYDMPASEDPPFDRDRRLPRPSVFNGEVES